MLYRPCRSVESCLRPVAIVVVVVVLSFLLSAMRGLDHVVAWEREVFVLFVVVVCDVVSASLECACRAPSRDPGLLAC